MMKILSLLENGEWKSKLNEAAADTEYQVTWIVNESKLFKQLQSIENKIVFLPQSASYDVYKLCEKILQRFPQMTVLLGFRSEEELDLKKALRAGAGDVIFLSSSISKIQEDINLAFLNGRSKMSQQMQSKSTKNATVITVASTKGGVGKTTVAVNLAASLAKKLVKVAVLDLDLQFGDVAMFFDVKPKRTIYDWVKEDVEGTLIEGFLTPYKDGISILAAPQRPEFAEVITGNYVRKAINALKKEFDVVIIDASSHINENVIVALENSDEILVMTYLDLPTLKNSKMLVDTLGSLQLGDRTKIVLNRQKKVKGITIDTVEKVVGQKIFSALPAMEKVMVTAVNEGKPLAYTNPRSKLAKRISQMAETLIKRESSSSLNKSNMNHAVNAGGHV